MNFEQFKELLEEKIPGSIEKIALQLELKSNCIRPNLNERIRGLERANEHFFLVPASVWADYLFSWFTLREATGIVLGIFAEDNGNMYASGDGISFNKKPPSDVLCKQMRNYFREHLTDI